MLQEGMNVDPLIQAQVLENKVAMAAVREASLEAGVQTALAENSRLKTRIIELEDLAYPQDVVEGTEQE